MSKIKVKGLLDDYALCLGIQTYPNAESIVQSVHSKSNHFAPKKAKSYKVSNLINTDYDGNTVEEITGYASFTVEYFTSQKEGQYKIQKEGK